MEKPVDETIEQEPGMTDKLKVLFNAYPKETHASILDSFVAFSYSYSNVVPGEEVSPKVKTFIEVDGNTIRTDKIVSRDRFMQIVGVRGFNNDSTVNTQFYRGLFDKLVELKIFRQVYILKEDNAVRKDNYAGLLDSDSRVLFNARSVLK